MNVRVKGQGRSVKSEDSVPLSLQHVYFSAHHCLVSGHEPMRRPKYRQMTMKQQLTRKQAGNVAGGRAILNTTKYMSASASAEGEAQSVATSYGVQHDEYKGSQASISLVQGRPSRCRR